MLRVISFAVLVAGSLSLPAFRLGGPKYAERPLPVNSTIARFPYLDFRTSGDFEVAVPGGEISPASSDLHILMLNYTAYDSIYVAKVHSLITRRLPGATLTDFWEGTPDDLSDALSDQQVVVVTYPANGSKIQVKAYGKVLAQFVRQGGSVIFSGTNQYSILQQFGLIDIDFGYFCSDLDVRETNPEHPVLTGTPGQFSMANYAYPLDISDPNFVTLADISDCPTMGYKSLGKGKVVYLGLEYYFDESVSTRIMENTLRWLTPTPKSVPTAAPSAPIAAEERWAATRVIKRSEEILYTGGGPAPKSPAVDLKIYPNPYFDKATLDINLAKTTIVMVELTDESGTLVATPYSRRTVGAGGLHVDLPDVSPGVYFVKCQLDGQSVVKKVVKVAAQ